jgi:protein arginine kinase
MSKWLEGSGSDNDIVISSRIRLARNIEDVKLPQFMDIDEAKKLTHMVANAVTNNSSTPSKDYELYEIEKISPLDRSVLVEQHLISQSLLEKPKISSFLLKKDEKVTIMVNEEDHLRIQVLLPGLNLEQGWSICNKIDDLLEEKLKYAFDERFGYLTCCPTNVGTGLRASVMVHLPCLVITGYINKVLQAVSQVGLTVRGLYGEGTGALGNIFQISNQTTLGESEEEIIQKLKSIVLQIIMQERETRNSLLSSKRLEVEDKVYRSLGVLQNSRIMTSKESMKLLSDVRMGIEMDIIKDIDINVINHLLINTQPAGIQKTSDSELTTIERDAKRAEIIRGTLKL